MKGTSFPMIAVVSLALLAGCRSSSSITATSAPSPAALNAYPKPSPDQIQKMLTPLQFEVTQNAATEPPFSNAYWNNHEAGIYVDVVTGQPLFSSADKFESGTGWPSFTRPIEDGAIASKSDETHGMDRTEVRSSSGDSHLGHVFDDGPAPTNMRYCINSASLRFVPIAKLDAEGYGKYRASVNGSMIAPSTSNSCAKPTPGEKPGCNTTLGIAIVYGDFADAMKKRAGVLQVERGSVDGSVATRVIYDPKALDAKTLGKAWSGDESAFKPVH